MSNLGKNILKEAEEIINGPRRESYGSADKSFQLIADLWSSYLDFPITKRDVANLMILLKVARDQNRPKHDNQLDIIGYAALADGFEKEEQLTGPGRGGHAPCSRPGNREAQDFEEKKLAKAYEKEAKIEDSPSSSNISSRRINGKVNG